MFPTENQAREKEKKKVVKWQFVNEFQASTSTIRGFFHKDERWGASKSPRYLPPDVR